ncbi:MAG: alpha/beta fold hydrolase, partial [Pseudomonadota bacterium]
GSDEVPEAPEPGINRYDRSSLSSPLRWPRDWNRSFELTVDDPRGGVLLLHGMSDSPYSLRQLGERLHQDGFHVVGLRYPGHGTAPGSLTRTTWEDMAGAVALAARYLAAELDGKPLYLFGYSTGAPLAVNYTLDALAGLENARPAGLVFFSPAMGVTPLAALTPWQARLGRLLGFKKMAWNSIEIEYDPFKYRSFPLNAAVQVWRLSGHVNARLAAAAASDSLSDMPPVLSFQSVVDSTIEASAVVSVLYDRVGPARGERAHELVAFDLNRSAQIEPILAADPRERLAALLADASRGYEFTVISNESSRTPEVMSRTGPFGELPERRCDLPEFWPPGVYSMTHVAPPFPPDDPLYGGERAKPYDGISLGNVVLRGEGGALAVSAAGFLRQSYNPFFGYQLQRINRFLGLVPEPVCLPRPGPESSG